MYLQSPFYSSNDNGNSVFNLQDYQEATHLEQFVTRFLLKETTSQLQSLQSSLECAMETTAEQTRQERQVTQNTLLHFVKHNIYQTCGVRRSRVDIFNHSLEAEHLACIGDCL